MATVQTPTDITYTYNEVYNIVYWYIGRAQDVSTEDNMIGELAYDAYDFEYNDATYGAAINYYVKYTRTTIYEATDFEQFYGITYDSLSLGNLEDYARAFLTSIFGASEWVLPESPEGITAITDYENTSPVSSAIPYEDMDIDENYSSSGNIFANVLQKMYFDITGHNIQMDPPAGTFEVEDFSNDYTWQDD